MRYKRKQNITQIVKFINYFVLHLFDTMSCNMVSQMNFLLYREQLNTPLGLLCYHTSVGKASKVCEMFMTAMHVCPTVLVANIILYSTKEAIKKLAWRVLFLFSYLDMLSDIMLFITFLH